VSTPLAAELIGLVVVLGLDRGNELGELVLVLVLDTGDDEGGGGLLVDDGTEACLALDDGVGDVQLAAKGGKPNDELEKLFVNTTKGVPKKQKKKKGYLNGIDIVGDEDKLGLLLLNEGSDVVDAKLDSDGLLGGLCAKIRNKKRLNAQE